MKKLKIPALLLSLYLMCMIWVICNKITKNIQHTFKSAVQIVELLVR